MLLFFIILASSSFLVKIGDAGNSMKGMTMEFRNMIIKPLVALCDGSGHFHIDLEDTFLMDQKKMLCETAVKLGELSTPLDEKKTTKTKVDEIMKEIANRIEYDLRQLTLAYARVATLTHEKRYKIEMDVGQIVTKENLDKEIGQSFKELFAELKKPDNIGKKSTVESREIVYKLLCICKRRASIKQKETEKTALQMAFRQFATINLFVYHLSLDLDDVSTHSAAVGRMGKIQKIAENWTNANGITLYGKETPAGEYNANLMV